MRLRLLLRFKLPYALLSHLRGIEMIFPLGYLFTELFLFLCHAFSHAANETLAPAGPGRRRRRRSNMHLRIPCPAFPR